MCVFTSIDFDRLDCSILPKKKGEKLSKSIAGASMNDECYECMKLVWTHLLDALASLDFKLSVI